MFRILTFLAPMLGRFLWKRYRAAGAARRSGVPFAATRPAGDQPQRQIEAMERAVDVPGGIRP